MDLVEAVELDAELLLIRLVVGGHEGGENANGGRRLLGVLEGSVHGGGASGRPAAREKKSPMAMWTLASGCSRVSARASSSSESRGGRAAGRAAIFEGEVDR